jgi:hypothetical protein
MAKTSMCMVLLLACGTTEVEPEVESGEVETEGAEVEEEVGGGVTRALAPDATYGDLVTLARELDGASRADSDAGCLLGPERLAADLALPLRPLPLPIVSLARALNRHSGPMRVLSRWGQRGAGRRAVAVFTMTPRTSGEALLVFVGEDGVRLRATGGEAGSPEPFADEALAERVGAARATISGPVVLVADAGASLARVRTLLAALPEDAVVALGVLLPEDTRLPQPLVPDDPEAGLCADGLPPTDEAEGQFDVAAARAALAELQEKVTRCNDYRSGSGRDEGTITVALRLSDGGAVSAACASGDTVGDPALRACTLAAVREVRFPDPAGVVDLAIPFRFEPSPLATQRPLCQ